jgi:predicted transcriptional regulator of viral defense system
MYRWRNKGLIAGLKKGLYELIFPQETAIPDMAIANKLYEPSYVSLETALSHYSVIPEVAMAVTSITTKSTRQFKNRHGLFIYRTLRPKSFTGYYLEKMGGFEVMLAEPEKAVMDYLYFKARRGETVDFGAERFDKTVISKMNKKKLNKYAGVFKLNLRSFYAYV